MHVLNSRKILGLKIYIEKRSLGIEDIQGLRTELGELQHSKVRKKEKS